MLMFFTSSSILFATLTNTFTYLRTWSLQATCLFVKTGLFHLLGDIKSLIDEKGQSSSLVAYATTMTTFNSKLRGFLCSLEFVTAEAHPSRIGKRLIIVGSLGNWKDDNHRKLDGLTENRMASDEI